jgi:rhamnulokinase
VLENAARVTGKRLQRIAIVGGGSLNRFLARLTAAATGLEVHCCVPESATIGNFAIQMATLEDQQNSRARIAHWARILTSLREC